MSQNQFSFSADCKALEQSIKRVSAIAGQDATNFLGIKGGKLHVFTLSPDTFAMLEVPNSDTSSKDSIFGFDATQFSGLVKGRAVMEFKYTGAECQFKQLKGKYSGKIIAISVSEDELAQIAEKSSAKSSSATLSPDDIVDIKSALAATAIADVYQNTKLLSYISLGSGKLEVTSFDGQHFGMFRLRTDSKASFKAVLPAAHFTTVEQLSCGSDTKFNITDTGLKAHGKGFSVSLPATQSDEKHHTLVADFIKSLPKPTYECTVDMESLSTVLDNLYSLYSSNTTFAVTAKGQSLTIGLSTSSGSASDSIKVAVVSGDAASFSVDPRLFVDIVRLAKANKTMTMKVTSKVVSFVQSDKGVPYVFLACALAK